MNILVRPCYSFFLKNKLFINAGLREEIFGAAQVPQTT